MREVRHLSKIWPETKGERVYARPRADQAPILHNRATRRWNLFLEVLCTFTFHL